ncbi:hypothetical protein [Amycolatopsis sp. NPDC059657]|uniref:hypothetical protein n=1 Tax=Amycolatopsis sp. NPDC059657 TaxID=3346899 RepID=UPI00366BB501
MTRKRQPEQQRVAGNDVADAGQVIPFRRRAPNPEKSWTFSVNVESVDGETREWLASELARAVHELLLWAHADSVGAHGDEEGFEERAA